MSRSIFVASSGDVPLDSLPISRDCILTGAPVGRAKVLFCTEDKTAYAVAWECSSGQFVWHYAEEETLIVISGEAFITDSAGNERRLSAGEVVVFPGGSSCTWRIPHSVRKVAILRKDMPRPLGIVVRAWHKFLRASKVRYTSPLSR